MTDRLLEFVAFGGALLLVGAAWALANRTASGISGLLRQLEARRSGKGNEIRLLRAEVDTLSRALWHALGEREIEIPDKAGGKVLFTLRGDNRITAKREPKS